jgi:chorismate-pyruvate lyase
VKLGIQSTRRGRDRTCKLETRKEILKIWRLAAGRLGRHFGQAAHAGLLARTYRVISGGRPVMSITEYFPLEPGADGDDTD